MGNLFSTRGNRYKSKATGYDPFINTSSQSVDSIDIALIQRLEADIRLLRNDLLQHIEKRERLEMKMAKMETYLQSRHAELVNTQMITNEKLNEKINIMARDMENLLNNDKLLLDKLMEKNIVSTIGEIGDE